MFTQNKKIELILVLQYHSLPAILKEQLNVQDDQEKYFSQFKIMQILQHYSDVPIFVEGNLNDTDYSKLDDENIKACRLKFPEYKNVAAMDFNDLTSDQKETLSTFRGAGTMLHLGNISCIYQTTEKKRDTQALLTQYARCYKNILKTYPLLSQKSLSAPGKPLELQIEPHDKALYLSFKKQLNEANPEIFANREKEALDFVLKICKKNDKSTALLIFGADHLDGFTKLINTSYKDSIILKTVIDSKKGILTSSPSPKPFR
jgi:hypothetical protein